MRLVHRPLQFTLGLALLVLLLLFGLSRTSWRPTAPLRLARRRAWGQTLAAAARMYLARPGLLLGIGILFIPISFLIALLQSLLVHGTDILGVETGSGARRAARLLRARDRDRAHLAQSRPRPGRDGKRRSSRSTAVARSGLCAPTRSPPTASGRSSGLSRSPPPSSHCSSSSIYLFPIAVWLAGRWALIAPSIELERLAALAGLRRSSLLVRGAWLKVASLIVVGAALSIALGPVVGVLLILGTSAPFWLVNVIAGLIYSLTMPLVAITTTYVYLDRRVSAALASPRPNIPASSSHDKGLPGSLLRSGKPPSAARARMFLRRRRRPAGLVSSSVGRLT